MTSYFDIAKSVQVPAKKAVEAKEAPRKEQASASSLRTLVDIRTARPIQRDPAERRLIAAGWTPKDRCGPLELTIWANPETGFYCSQEVALHRLDQHNGTRGEL